MECKTAVAACIGMRIRVEIIAELIKTSSSLYYALAYRALCRLLISLVGCWGFLYCAIPITAVLDSDEGHNVCVYMYIR